VTAPQGARVAPGGAIPGVIAPVDHGAPGATGGHGARPSRGATLADGGSDTGGRPVSSCGNETYVPGAQSRACAREIREGGVPPAEGAGVAGLHPEDARTPDPYAAGRVACLLCGASWEARS